MYFFLSLSQFFFSVVEVMTTSPPDKTIQQPSYLIAASTTTTTTALNGGNDTPALCDIKILCTQRKKVCKIYKNKKLKFVFFLEK